MARLIGNSKGRVAFQPGIGSPMIQHSSWQPSYGKPRTIHYVDINVPKAGAAIVGAGVAGYGGYKAYQHRGEIADKAHLLGTKVSGAFHSTRHMVGAGD